MKQIKTKLAIFESKKIRRVWNEKREKWYFSVVDIIAALTNSGNPQVYWRVFKKRLIDEGSGETVTKCNGLQSLLMTLLLTGLVLPPNSINVIRG